MENKYITYGDFIDEISTHVRCLKLLSTILYEFRYPEYITFEFVSLNGLHDRFVRQTAELCDYLETQPANAEIIKIVNYEDSLMYCKISGIEHTCHDGDPRMILHLEETKIHSKSDNIIYLMNPQMPNIFNFI